MSSYRGLIVAAALVTFIGAPAIAQNPEPDSQLDELLNTPISTAAKYDQPLSSVAASVTVITDEEMARYGWYTLADVLRGLRGVYTTYDRGYTYLGVRGIGLPTDYNNRFLVLIDGHPFTESVSGSVGIDTTLAIDLSHYARIEFVRGPGSVVYGTGAMFGVINLITKNESEQASALIGTGTAGLWTSAARAGFGRGELRGSIAASWQEKQGSDQYFHEFDHPDTNGGIARDRDYDDYQSVMATLRWRDLHVLALHSARTKGVPTASWGSTFGGNQQIFDGRTMFALDYDHRIDPARVVAVDVFYDRFHYKGNYPGSTDDYEDHSQSARLGGELRYVWDVRPNHRLTFGSEIVRNHRAAYTWEAGEANGGIGGPFSTLSVYAQSESHLTRSLSVTAGASIAWHPRLAAQVTPRLAAILRTSSSSTVKALYGRAFRSPTIYELDYANGGFLPSDGLESEDLETLELVWEQRIGSDVLATLSLFELQMADVIRLQTVPEGVQFQNVGRAHSHGLELQFDHRTNSGIWSYGNFTYQQAKEADAPRINSPRQMVKAGVSTPTARRLFGGVEMQYESGRLTLAGQKTDDVLLTNLNLGLAVMRYVELTTTVRNVFDVDYATPGGPEHRQDVLPQNGRELLVRLHVRRR